MAIKLRDYQEKAKRAVLEEWKEVRSTLVVLPTGSGKTVLFSGIIHAIQPLKTVVIAHREELIWQAKDKIQRVSGIECAVEMGDYHTVGSSGDLFGNPQVVVATVQTLNSRANDRRRIGKFHYKDFGLVIIDEAHHATATTYKNAINYFTQNTSLKILGVTATPDRADEEALGQVFDSVAFDYEILDAIHDGWLVPVQQQLVNIDGLDFSEIRTTAGDLNGADLAQVMEAESNLHGVAGALTQIMGNRKTLVFTSSVKQAEVMSEIFNRYKPGCSTWVCGKTPKEDRRRIVSEYAKGKWQVVVNCDCFTEGFDDPSVEIIGMAKPTKSRSKYAQMCGRSMRPLPGVVDGGYTEEDSAEFRRERIANSPKPNCLIVDFVGNSGKHKLMTAFDILGGNVSDEAVDRAIKIAKKGGAILVDATLDEEEERIKQEREEARKREHARKAKLMANVKFTARTVNPFDLFDITPARERGWDSGKTLSEKQRMLLLKQGVDPTKLPYAQGRQLISELFRRWNGKLATLGQCKVLKKYGYDTKDMTMKAASQLLDRLKQNGWRKVEYGKQESIRQAEVPKQRTNLPIRDETGRHLGSGTAPPQRVAGPARVDSYNDQTSDGDVYGEGDGAWEQASG